MNLINFDSLHEFKKPPEYQFPIDLIDAEEIFELDKIAYSLRCEFEKPLKFTTFKTPINFKNNLDRYYKGHFSRKKQITFERYNKKTGEINYICGLAKKRGCKSYNNFLIKRTIQIKEQFKNISYFDEKKNLSNLIFVTLTFPDKMAASSWINFSKNTKLYLDSLRKSKIKNLLDQYCIVLESTLSGVAHAHIVFCLKDPVKYARRTKKDKSGKVKKDKLGKDINYNFILNKTIYNCFKNWPYFSSVEVCENIKSLGYILKYISKGFADVESIYNKYSEDPDSLTDPEKKVLFGMFLAGIQGKRGLRLFRTSRGIRADYQPEGLRLDIYKNNYEFKLHKIADYDGFKFLNSSDFKINNPDFDYYGLSPGEIKQIIFDGFKKIINVELYADADLSRAEKNIC